MDITWLDIWKFHGAALLAGCVIDWIIGDPLWLPHPVLSLIHISEPTRH